MDNTQTTTIQWSTIIQWIITILGFVATIIGSLLALSTFISPFIRLRRYLKKTNKWKKVYVERHRYNWQYQNHPEFAIEIDNDGEKWDTKEKWMPHCPDPSKRSSLVKVRVNGQTILTENFISLDGGKYFVPVAKREIIGELEENYKYYFISIQIQLARIVGDFYRCETVEKFIEENRLEIRDK